MNISERIKQVCTKTNHSGHGVMPPQVCPYCFGCPIATLVVGISGNNNQVVAKSIPEKDMASVNAWLDKLDAKYN